MNDIDLLNEHGPEATELSAEAWRSARTRLSAEITGPAHRLRPRLLPRMALAGLAGVAAVVTAISVLPGTPDLRPGRAGQPTVTGSYGPIRLVATTAPEFPLALPGISEVTFTADPGGPIMGIFGEAGTDDTVVLIPEESEPGGRIRGQHDVDVGGRNGTIVSLPSGDGSVSTVQLSWERREDEWVTIVGNGRYASETEVLRLARSVVDRPQRLGFKVTLGLVPAGWRLGGFKGDDRSASIISYLEPGTERAVHVAWYAEPPEEAAAEGFRAEQRVTVGGRAAKLTRTADRWILAGGYADGSAFQLQAPPGCTEAQVIEMGGSIRVH